MNFDGIARWYQVFEYLAFGRALERTRLAYVNEVANARSVLLLGDGDGRFTAEFVKRNPHAVVDFVDLSAEMVKLAEQRVGPRTRLRVGDARTMALEGKYDLVVTHFFLDCFTEEELAALIARVSAACLPNGRWLVSEFALPAGGVSRIGARALIRMMYFFFRVMTGLKVKRLPDYAPLLTRNGFEIAQRRKTLGGLLVSELFRTKRDHRVDERSAPGWEPGGE